MHHTFVLCGSVKKIRDVWGLKAIWVPFTKFSFTVCVAFHQFSFAFFAPFLCHHFLYILSVYVRCRSVRRFKVWSSKSKIIKGFSNLHWSLSFSFSSHCVYALWCKCLSIVHALMFLNSLSYILHCVYASVFFNSSKYILHSTNLCVYALCL